MGFFFCNVFGGICALWLRSVKDSFVTALVLTCFLNIEKTGRLFWRGGGELRGAGDEGGLDLLDGSEKMAGDSFGLDVGGEATSHGGED